MANRSIDRIRNKKSKDDPVGYWPFSNTSIENIDVVYVTTGDYADDAFGETPESNIDSE